jgi:hypothetical protein
MLAYSWANLGLLDPRPRPRFRFELENPTDALSLKVISGYAELFGIELVTGATYGFRCAPRLRQKQV